MKEVIKTEMAEVESKFLGYQTEMNELYKRVKESLQLLEQHVKQLKEKCIKGLFQA